MPNVNISLSSHQEFGKITARDLPVDFLRKSLITLVLVCILFSILREWFNWNQDVARQIGSAVKKASTRFNLDPHLIKAFIWKESRFQPDARGQANEIGLMQIRDAAAREWAEAEKVSPFVHEHVSDIETNILAGSWYLAKLMKRYTKTDNPIPYALADYNAGRGNVLKWIRGKAATNSVEFLAEVGFPSTHQYIQDVIEKRNNLRAGKP